MRTRVVPIVDVMEGDLPTGFGSRYGVRRSVRGKMLLYIP
jgi:hypothetical protein